MLALGLALGACSESSVGAGEREAELSRLQAACVHAMLKSTCQVMSGPAASDATSVVFVAGIGPVDGKAYRELRASGEAMCGVVMKACRDKWSSAQCTTARALWPAAARPK